MFYRDLRLDWIGAGMLHCVRGGLADAPKAPKLGRSPFRRRSLTRGRPARTDLHQRGALAAQLASGNTIPYALN
jgi:hypothetical protein